MESTYAVNSLSDNDRASRIAPVYPGLLNIIDGVKSLVRDCPAIRCRMAENRCP